MCHVPVSSFRAEPFAGDKEGGESRMCRHETSAKAFVFLRATSALPLHRGAVLLCCQVHAHVASSFLVYATRWPIAALVQPQRLAADMAGRAPRPRGGHPRPPTGPPPAWIAARAERHGVACEAPPQLRRLRPGGELQQARATAEGAVAARVPASENLRASPSSAAGELQKSGRTWAHAIR